MDCSHKPVSNRIQRYAAGQANVLMLIFLFICKFSRWHRCVLMSCGCNATAPHFCFASHQRHRGNMTCYIDHPPIQDIRLQNVWNNLLAQIRSTELPQAICHKLDHTHLPQAIPCNRPGLGEESEMHMWGTPLDDFS